MLIGILGKKGSGKDTCADYLVKKYNFKKISFATPLKTALISIFNMKHNQLYGEEKEIKDKYWDIEPRKLMQYFGTDLMRDKYDKNIWLKSISKWLENNKEYNIVIPDCRFQNEVDFILEKNGIVIKIDRYDEIKDNHISENEINEIKNFTYCIKNNDTLDKLYFNLDKYIKIKNNNKIEKQLIDKIIDILNENNKDKINTLKYFIDTIN
jgi:cytidylate kinase